MADKRIKNIVIVGGGTAGWMTAAAMSKVLGTARHSIKLVESEMIGTIGVGEATIPMIQLYNRVLGLDENEFVRETNATFKLGIEFVDWKKIGDRYFHPFGHIGVDMDGIVFTHFWDRWNRSGGNLHHSNFNAETQAARAGRFIRTDGETGPKTMPDINYAFQFDASLYAAFLRKYSEARGARRAEGKVVDVIQDPESGDITSLKLESGDVIEGDFFVDCSGFRGLLIEQVYEAGYDDWSHWLPCDRAKAVPSERFEETLPYTRAIAHSAGWQWRITHQHRNGNGQVYSRNQYRDDEAASILLNNLDSKAIAEPKIIPFRTGRTRKQWNRNVVAVGLSSGFLEPLESTSIYLIQSAIVRLLHLFPHAGVTPELVDEYNKQSKREYELIRDFIILHYYLNERDDSQFWRDTRNMDVPQRLIDKINLLRANGNLVQDQLDIFLEPSWLQVMMGQGVIPQDYHPIAGKLSEEQLKEKLVKTMQLKKEPLPKIPSHDEFLKMFCKNG